MIKIKNKYLNINKVISLEFATSEKNNKFYVIVFIDTPMEINKIFIEITGEDEFNFIIDEVKKQMK